MNVTPDGQRYLAIAGGERTARPFHYRWLIPTVCGMDEKAWLIARAASLAVLCISAFWYAGGGWKGAAVAIIPFGLAGVFRFNWNHPVLVDLPAMALALASAACWEWGNWPAAILFALLSGMVKETGPVFAAVWAWSPLPLIGLVPVAARMLWPAGPDVYQNGPAHDALVHPFREAWRSHRTTLFDDAAWWVWVLPWGALVVALTSPSWQVAVVLLLAYGQCVIATDRVRLYSWAWPVLAVATFDAVPRAWWLVLLALHLANPFKTEGL